MTRFALTPPQGVSFGRRASVSTVVAAGLMALAMLNGCSGLQPLPPEARYAARGSWLSLQGVYREEVVPGVHVELPNAPYRARFADQNGIYYQASGPVVYRTVHGIATAVEGGLYARFDQPTVAVVWTEPLWGSATMTYPHTYPVQRFTDVSNGLAP